jgi:glycosyltransferase involved in cell wall biosynthesis
MRICYLSDAASQHTIKWAQYFSAHHHNVQIISFRQSEEPQVQQWTQVISPRWQSKLDIFFSAPRVRRLIENFKPDIVHAHYASSYGTLGRLCRFHPFLLSVWGSDVYDFPRRSWLHRKLLQANLAAADHLCSSSKNMAAETQRYWPKPVSITPFGVDCDLFRPSFVPTNSENEFVIGTIKALEPPYGIDYLLRAFALLTRKYAGRKKLRLAIAGDGSLRKSLERLAADLGIRNDVSFLGHIAHSQVPQLLNTFSVFCALSLSESFGVAILEASACQLPVVVTNIGGLPEVVRDNLTGFIVSAHNAQAAADAVAKLIEDSSLRCNFGEAGRKFVLENFEWSENAKRMENVYESLLKST